MSNRKKVVVFGGSGFLGGYVCDELTRRDYEVVVADIAPSEYLQESQRFVQVDIMDRASLQPLIEGAEIVYNFVAIANLDEAIGKPAETMEINVIGHLNILEACRQSSSVKRFVYASSAYALSNEGSFYGISKHTAEKLTEEYYKQYGLEYSIIRYGSLYGERASHNNYIYNILSDALQSGVLQYKGDGQEIREYIHAADAAKLSVDILEDTQYINEHVILTGVEKLKRLELLTMISEIMGNRIDIQQSDTTQAGHYKITPYAFHPTVAKKLVANPYIDMGQGLLECIKVISEKMHD